MKVGIIDVKFLLNDVGERSCKHQHNNSQGASTTIKNIQKFIFKEIERKSRSLLFFFFQQYVSLLLKIIINT